MPGISIDVVHLMILKLVLHSIRETMKDNDDSPLWISLANYISKATFYRKMAELEMLGFVSRISRTKYLISISGYLLLVFAYFMGVGTIDRDTVRLAVKAIKGNWGLVEFSDDEVESYIKLLYLSSKGKSVSEVLALYQEFPKNVLFILPNNLKFNNSETLHELIINKYGDADTVNKARRVIAKALLDYFPTSYMNGCRAVSIINNGEPKVLAMECGKGNYILN